MGFFKDLSGTEVRKNKKVIAALKETLAGYKQGTAGASKSPALRRKLAELESAETALSSAKRDAYKARAVTALPAATLLHISRDRR